MNICKKLVQSSVLSIKRSNVRHCSSMVVLGIETSCDDTGAAVIEGSSRTILGHALHGQQRTHTLHGGIQPIMARDLHQQHLPAVVEEAMRQAGLQYADLDAVAATVKPGLHSCLTVGAELGKSIALQHGLPFIPVHHMEAHALTVRLQQQEVVFPFLCLLVSGGHSLLVLCRDIDSYSVLGTCLDDAPGEALDKAGRYLNLRALREFMDMSGGAAIERLAAEGDPHAFRITPVAPLSQQRNCNFSLAGLKSALKRLLERLEEEHGLDGDTALPRPVLANVCATFQHAVFEHITRRTSRALVYCDAVYGHQRCNTLVVSGGVASNASLRQWLGKVCAEADYKLVCPPPQLCTDNGIMVAWSGVERLRSGGRGVLTDPEDIRAVEVMHRCPLGEDISADVTGMSIKIKKWIKM